MITSDINKNIMMQPQTNTNSAVPITSTAAILNLDHYKYLRSLLPTVPHFIESLSFTDLNNWECQIYVNLQTESDCMKWLADFEDKTNTDWKVDKDAPRSNNQTIKIKGCIWQMVYRCIPMDSKKDCSGKLEMRIVNPDEADRNRNGKQYPCQVSINFYHNHNTTNSSLFNMESFKSQDIPSHLKEGFEGYFQETMQPVTNGASQTNQTINLNSLKPQTTLLNSPLTHTISSNQQPVVIKTEVPSLSPVSHGQHLDGKLLPYDLGDLSDKLDNALQVLKRMLKQSTGTGLAAVKHFAEKFEKLQGDPNQLEDALTSFGGQWDWLVATEAGSGQGSQAQPLMVSAPVTTTLQQHYSLSTQQHSIHSPSTDLTSPKQKPKKKLKLDEKEIAALTATPQSVFSSNIVGGQLVLHPQTPVTANAHAQPGHQTPTTNTDTGTDTKKRKRARCGNCSGCLNRDKTQDCRQCRNCLDQKRYGGPGRLKKACIKRQCVVISQVSSSVDTSHHNDNKPASAPVLAPSGQVSAVKSEPVFSVKSEATPTPISIAPTPAQLTSPAPAQSSAPTLLSWPASQYAPTFQLQVQQPVQFAFQPSMTSYNPVTTTSPGGGLSSLQGLQYTTSAGGAPQIQTLSATQLGAV